MKASLSPERRPPARLVAVCFTIAPCWEAGAPLSAMILRGDFAIQPVQSLDAPELAL